MSNRFKVFLFFISVILFNLTKCDFSKILEITDGNHNKKYCSPNDNMLERDVRDMKIMDLMERYDSYNEKFLIPYSVMKLDIPKKYNHIMKSDRYMDVIYTKNHHTCHYFTKFTLQKVKDIGYTYIIDNKCKTGYNDIELHKIYEEKYGGRILMGDLIKYLKKEAKTRFEENYDYYPLDFNILDNCRIKDLSQKYPKWVNLREIIMKRMNIRV